MKVALINPGKNHPRFLITEPLNLGFIAGYLIKNGIEVKIIDELAGDNVEKEIEEYKPDIVGITGTTPVITNGYRIADFCRKKGIRTVIGGVHASTLPEEALKHADIVVVGEGEQAILDIIRENIKSGIVKRPFIKNLDEIPMPARDLINMNFYLTCKKREPFIYIYNFAPLNAKTATIFASRGCTFDCIFCHNNWRDTPYRFNSPERTVSEIEFLVERYGVECVFFTDDDLFSPKKRLQGLCYLLKERNINIKWGCNARVDSIDKETILIAKEVGLSSINFGFESGSQKILNIMRKRTTVEQNREAVKLCKQIGGILIGGYFMIGNPDETKKDIYLTRKFIKENPIDSVTTLITTAYPGTELWKYCKDKNLIIDSFDWNKFNYEEVPIRICDEFTTNELEKIRIKIQIEAQLLNPQRLMHFLKISIQQRKSIFGSRIFLTAKKFITG